MDKFKKQIKTKLKEYTADELGDTLDSMKQEVNRELPDLEPDEVEDIVSQAVTTKKDGDSITEVNNEVMQNFIDQYGEERGKEIYYATANKQDRDPETFHMDEIDGEDYERASREVQHGINPEGGELDYSELDAIINDINNSGNPEPEVDDTEDVLPFEGVNPRMTKNELTEAILSRVVKPKVIKSIKVKDLRNE